MSSVTSVIFTPIPIISKRCSYLWHSVWFYYNSYLDHMSCHYHRICFYCFYNIGCLFINLSKVILHLDTFLVWTAWTACFEYSFPSRTVNLLIWELITSLSSNTTILCLCAFSSFIVKNSVAPVLCPVNCLYNVLVGILFAVSTACLRFLIGNDAQHKCEGKVFWDTF